jgi:hypothetical protein
MVSNNNLPTDFFCGGSTAIVDAVSPFATRRDQASGDRSAAKTSECRRARDAKRDSPSPFRPALYTCLFVRRKTIIAPAPRGSADS